MPQARYTREGVAPGAAGLAFDADLNFLARWAGPLGLLARAMLAYIFIVEGVGKIAGYAGVAGYMQAHGVDGRLLPLVILTELRQGDQQPQACDQGGCAERAVQAGARVMHAGDGAPILSSKSPFPAEKPALLTGPDGAKARLPDPQRKPNPREAAILRGLADSFALRLACHSDAIHRRHAPQNPAAQALFDAVEQAPVEAIGARRMEGVART